jgi:hypothetical protein
MNFLLGRKRRAIVPDRGSNDSIVSDAIEQLAQRVGANMIELIAVRASAEGAEEEVAASGTLGIYGIDEFQTGKSIQVGAVGH